MMKTLVLLHGWGGNSRTWDPLLPLFEKHLPEWRVLALDLPGFGDSPAIENFELDVVLAVLAEKIPEGSVLVGWSLGGMLAVQLAANYPQKIAAVMTLAANAKFVADETYAAAMQPAVNQHFNQQFASNGLQTLKLFSGLLAQGDENERALLKTLRAQINADEIKPEWHSTLLVLSQVDNRSALQSLRKPCVHLLAEKDALVPVAAAESLRQLNPAHNLVVFENTAHALHWSRPDLVVDELCVLVKSLPAAAIDKKKIAQSFSRAASQYNHIAQFQKQLGQKLVAQLPELVSPQVVVDLGCGTGVFLSALQTKYPQASVFGLDLAESMVLQARGDNPEHPYLVADAEYLPFADESVDLIFSNLVVQWCTSPTQLLSELARVLKPNGQVIFSTLASRSLHELKSAWQLVDEKIHVNTFHSASTWQEFIVQHFTLLQSDNDLHTEWFADLKSLTRSIKGVGAKNLNEGRPQGLSGRKRIQAFAQAYENYRQNNLLPLTYDVLIVNAQKSNFS